MDVVIWQRHKVLKRNTWELALAQGFEALGFNVHLRFNYRRKFACKFDLHVCWGMGHRCIEEVPKHQVGRRVLVAEMPYVGLRHYQLKSERLKFHQFVSLAWGGLNGRGDHCFRKCKRDRMDKHGFKIPVLRDEGKRDFVLLAGQVEFDHSHKHVDIQKWYQDAARWIRSQTDLPIVFRNHPFAKTVPDIDAWGVENIRISSRVRVRDSLVNMSQLSVDLSRSRDVVVFNSNVAVDAMMKGCPVTVFDSGCMAYPVSTMFIGQQAYEPDRQQWLANLMYTQWKYDEVISGQFWDHLQIGY